MSLTRRSLLVIMGLAVLVIVTFLFHDAAVVAATVVGAFCTAVMALPGIAGKLRKLGIGRDNDKDAVAGAVAALAQAVTTEAEDETKLLQLQDPWPLQVTWANTKRPVSDHWQAIHGLPGRNRPVSLSGKIGDICAVFAKVPSGRLVILGGPGAGKTVLALALIQALLEQRGPADPVAVRFPLESWNPAELSLRAWMARWLSDSYGGQRGRRRTSVLFDRLIAAGLVLPVLDGLDEIPPPLRLSALGRLNRELGKGDRLVLTCRPDEYEEMVGAPDGDVLTAAAVIEMQPLRYKDLREYLRVTTSRSRADKWEPLFADLAQHPDGPAAEALSTPLMAWLARTAYSESPADPAELVALGAGGQRLLATREQVEECLLGRLVPAVFAPTARRPHVRRWNAAAAQRWLGFLARYLHKSGSYDLAWWRLSDAVPAIVFGVLFGGVCGFAAYGLAALDAAIIDPTIDPVKEALATAIAVCAAAALVTTAVRWRGETAYAGALNFVRRFTLGFAIALPLGFPAYLITGYTAGLSYSTQPSRVRVRFRGFGRKFALRAAIGFVAGFGVAWPLGYGLAGLQVSNALSFALGGGVGIGLTSGLTASFSPAASVEKFTGPKGTLRQDRAATLIYALVFGLMWGVLAALSATILALDFGRFAFGDRAVSSIPTVAVVAVIAILGAAFGVIFSGLIAICSTWGIFLISRAWLAARGRCPWRLMRFLADSRDLGVLRQVGGVYQFRHNRLQDRLAADARSGQTRRASAGGQPSSQRPGRWRRLAVAARSPARIAAAVAIVGALAIADSFYPQVLSRPLPPAPRSGSGYLLDEFPSVAGLYSPSPDDDAYQFDSARPRHLGRPHPFGLSPDLLPQIGHRWRHGAGQCLWR